MPGSSLKIWLIQPGEPLPFEDGSPRLMRTGIIAKALADRGHVVTWFASTFSHSKKLQLFPKQTDVDVGERLKIVCLAAREYQRNVSVARLLSHRDLQLALRADMPRRPTPDVIVASMPNPDLVMEACDYAIPRNIPVLTDIRDLWPEAWTYLAPPFARPLARVALTPFYRQLQSGLSRSAGILAISAPILDWGLKHAGRAQHSHDRVFPSAYRRPALDVDARVRAESFWREKDVIGPDVRNIACFVGTLSRRSSLALIDIVQSFRGAPDDVKARWRLVLCGDGDLVPDLKTAAQDDPSIILPGWINAHQIWSLMTAAKIGLIPYANDPDFLSAYPNKFGEYLSAGLPIYSVVNGLVGQTIGQENVGWAAGPSGDFLAALRDAEDGSRWEKKRDNALILYDKQFDSERVYVDYANHIEAMAARST